ncbi:ferrous iron transport protein A [Atopobacter sp. AH10]|uniref:FeoA family protein n=1 Tax=Atopobacter sp. AH10 TaxID=2315861 RepID=UPI000EF23C0B|nr:FeoA family protein [Atopobacter sp. AH10]RLK63424.1 ferrous iron transport protein A [Atopobacter sp. AH10]
MTTLREIPCGEKVTVVKVHGDGALRKRIRDMGMTKGAEVFVKKVAPLGDPIELTIRGYALTIRKEDAAVIEVSTEGE